jgi:hypothetical protein
MDDRGRNLAFNLGHPSSVIRLFSYIYGNYTGVIPAQAGIHLEHQHGFPLSRE